MRHRARWLTALIGVGMVSITVTVGSLAGCGAEGRRGASRGPGFYPPQPQEPHVVALGTLRGAKPPSEAEVRLAEFVFGAEPPAPLMIANPTGLAAESDCVLICDNALHMILRWNASTRRVDEGCRSPVLRHPFAIDIAPTGERLICDRQGVWRCDGGGYPERAYYLPEDQGPFKPAGVVGIGDAVWVANHAQHRIEVFDRETGEYRRSIGVQGSGPGEFALPRSMTRTPNGNVCIVDMLNNRVQVLDPAGNWVRDVGQAGNAVGAFGRPKDVAIGPDGVMFVTDAFSQRVHAFAPDGTPLLSFGEPGSGVGELTVPNGIVVSEYAPQTEIPQPDDIEPDYYVLVAEQLNNPGVRVYAWLGGTAASTPQMAALPSGEALSWAPHFPESTVINPHWDPQRCDTCHDVVDGRMQSIPLDEADRLCLDCHDGVQAPADPHPIGRPARTAVVTTPEEWPTPGGDIGCMTCHDIIRHCDREVRRPAINYVLLRGFDPQRPLAYCTTCHHASASGRFSPHRQRDDQGRVRDDACFFCHTARPEIPPNGERQFEPMLRDSSSDLCLNCHSPHWDLSPKGHVDRPVTPEIRQWMLIRELGLDVDAPPQELATMVAESNRRPARLPLGAGMVTCYTCHNPHYTGLFPEDSELGALADEPRDRKAALRTDWIDLCSECHHH